MHILLVEDDLDLGAEIQRALAAQGFTSEWVRRLGDARALTDVGEGKGPCFACAVLDLGLPDGEGLSLLRHWRQQVLVLPVIVLTARDALEPRIAGLDAGADDFLVKPVAMRELASRLRAVTRRAAGQAAATWSVGRVHIDTGRREVRLDGEPVQLSPKEFSILVELARHGGDVVAKHRLARAVAPLGEPMEFSALEWHVHNLRRKLGEDCVRTVRGVGYCVSAGC